MGAVAKSEQQSKALTLEQVLIGGDLAKLSPEQRIEYYNRVCETCSLNPLTQPFTYMTLNGKLVLYANRSCTDQLRFVRGVSVEETSEAERDGVFIVTAKVKDRDGRTDIARGAVNIANLKGEVLANAIMKAETKAKRRATLSICGLSMLDEVELDTIPSSAKGPTFQPQLTPPPAPKPNGSATGGGPQLTEADERRLDRTFNPETGEIIEDAEIADDSFDDQNLVGKEDAKWAKWGDDAIAAFNAAKTPASLSGLLQKNNAPLETCKRLAPAVYDRIIAAYRKRAGELSGGAGEDLPEFLRRPPAPIDATRLT